METIKDRTKRFALNIIKLTNELPKNTPSFVIAKQIIRSATSIGANYRACLRARSKSEFIAKLGIVLEEADETVYWLELIVESCLVPAEKVRHLLNEANEITSIIVASLKTAKSNPSRSFS
jgi:four helix bundle protein